MERLRHAVFVAIFAFAAWLSVAHGAGYLSSIPDLPLMPGLAEIAGAGLEFDDPQGRIVEAFASGRVERAAVIAFYRATLPPLGWSALDDTRYRRGRDHLLLDFVPGSGDVTVRFLLTPR
ncbi:MAG: hypothetical protein FJX51_01490 [Alphaproteobacteria bacterium]|nr:hypothetical protein [Alphaproteobacteria bacterium]